VLQIESTESDSLSPTTTNRGCRDLIAFGVNVIGNGFSVSNTKRWSVYRGGNGMVIDEESDGEEL